MQTFGGAALDTVKCPGPGVVAECSACGAEDTDVLAKRIDAVAWNYSQRNWLHAARNRPGRNLTVRTDFAQERHEVIEECVVGVGPGRVVVSVGGLAVDQGEVAHRYVRLFSQDLRRVKHLSSSKASSEGVDQQALREGVTHGGVDVEHALGRIRVPVGHCSRVIGQALGEVPLCPIGVLDPCPREHRCEAVDRRESSRAVPAMVRT